MLLLGQCCEEKALAGPRALAWSSTYLFCFERYSKLLRSQYCCTGRNLLTNNVAFGTANESKKPAPTKQRSEASGAAAEGLTPDPDPTGIPDAQWEEMRRAREAFEARQAQSGAQESNLPLKEGAEPRPAHADFKGRLSIIKSQLRERLEVDCMLDNRQIAADWISSLMYPAVLVGFCSVCHS